MAPRRRFDAILFTCEHGGARIPQGYQALFKNHQEVLATHRGYDIGALPVAKALAQRWGGELFFSTISRLIIDLNRSENHPKAFSEWTRDLPESQKKKVIQTFYRPYRSPCEEWLKRKLARGNRVLHLSIHSFTPNLNGDERNADIGILYDPKRPLELSFAKTLHQALNVTQGHLRVRRNYPYLGYADGFQTYLRKHLSHRAYAGLELEMNQAITKTASGRKLMINAFSKAFEFMGGL